MTYENTLKKAYDFLSVYSDNMENEWAGNIADALWEMSEKTQPVTLSKVVLISAVEILNAIGDEQEDGDLLDIASELEKFEQALGGE
jgi:hypothetical protein